MTEQIVTRKEAKALGLKFYFTGKPCKRGHISKRRTCDGRCVKCDQTTEYKAADAARNKAWREKNPEKKKASLQAWRAANPEKKKVSDDAWYAGNIESEKQRTRARYESDKEKWNSDASKWAKSNPEKRKATCSAWARNNKPSVAAAGSRYRSTKLRATPAWANHDLIRAIYEESDRRTRLTGIRHHVDHIVPLKSTRVCGLHWEGNLQVLTQAENDSKGNRYWPDM
jgi:hypothetical protein